MAAKHRSGCDPQHPGVSVRRLFLDHQALSVGEGAAMLGVSRTNFSLLLNGRFAISPEMAVRLSRVTGVPARVWSMLQLEYDLAKAEEKLAGKELVKSGTGSSE